MYKSNCCGADVKMNQGVEGTNCFVCESCNQVCDVSGEGTAELFISPTYKSSSDRGFLIVIGVVLGSILSSGFLGFYFGKHSNDGLKFASSTIDAYNLGRIEGVSTTISFLGGYYTDVTKNFDESCAKHINQQVCDSNAPELTASCASGTVRYKNTAL